MHCWPPVTQDCKDLRGALSATRGLAPGGLGTRQDSVDSGQSFILGESPSLSALSYCFVYHIMVDDMTRMPPKPAWLSLCVSLAWWKKRSWSEKAVLGATFGIPGYSRSSSWNCAHDLSYVKPLFSEQLSERLRNWSDAKISVRILGAFLFKKSGVVPARQTISLDFPLASRICWSEAHTELFFEEFISRTPRVIDRRNPSKSEQIGTDRGIPEKKEPKSEQIGRKLGKRNRSGWPPCGGSEKGCFGKAFPSWSVTKRIAL